MGSSASFQQHTPAVKVSAFRAQSLRAPLFAKPPPERIDPKANHKYCNEEITYH